MPHSPVALAIPDLRREIEQMIVWPEIVSSHICVSADTLRSLRADPGQGQTINFIATDIYRVADGRVAENWHIEDNLTLQPGTWINPQMRAHLLAGAAPSMTPPERLHTDRISNCSNRRYSLDLRIGSLQARRFPPDISLVPEIPFG
jgi:SnoaL-like polyketide cyclase